MDSGGNDYIDGCGNGTISVIVAVFCSGGSAGLWDVASYMSDDDMDLLAGALFSNCIFGWCWVFVHTRVEVKVMYSQAVRRK